MSQDYNATLNLPQTDFPMRGNLPKREPAMLTAFEPQGLYSRLIQKNKGKPLYVLHDGPPYANGNIHMGTALNKLLKDMIIRYRNMAGYQAPYVPGWDTHGLPIELKALKKEGVNPATITPLALRALCKEFALSFIEEMTQQFQRLGILGDFDHPYRTLDPSFVAKQIEVFGAMAMKNFIYKGLKPVYWCPTCVTALAEAEIEYGLDPCDSVYVKFPLQDDQGKFSKLPIDTSKLSFVIWTTTTWTLPGNLAICLGPTYEYAVVAVAEEFLVIAKERVAETMEAAGIGDYRILATYPGSELEHMVARHPFLPRTSLIICGDHVTLDSGTGCVHTAPGHGVEDFEVCKHYDAIGMVVPVDDAGNLTQEAGQFARLSTREANQQIAAFLEQGGFLFARQSIEHDYPHCWRCKQPVLFRATEQWFCSMDGFKQQALAAIKQVQWQPKWGEDRIASMIQDRSDWCISRQRIWGVPIPIVYCKACEQPLVTEQTIQAIAAMVRQEGSDAWYQKDPADFLPASLTCPCGGQEFVKETDIMDVWFDSGVSHAAVLAEREELAWPADLYLEGGDQYRGWFQSSLLTAVAWQGTAPYKAVCTHGWVVDGQGKKMSKSLGNGMQPQEILGQYGADILRLWVASSDYHADIRISKDILTQLSDAYRKIRNTAKYILGNLHDFDPNQHSVPLAEMPLIDQLILVKYHQLIETVRKSYEELEFHGVYHAIYQFCVVELSNFYLDIVKDRLYCETADGTLRRSAQTTIYRLLDGLTRLLAPILAFTSQEIWQAMPHQAADDAEHVLFNPMPTVEPMPHSDELVANWEKLVPVYTEAQKALEQKRVEKLIGKPLDAKVTFYASEPLLSLLQKNAAFLQTVLICSQVAVADGVGEFVAESLEGLSMTVEKAAGSKCERCWGYDPAVGSCEEHNTLCPRCVKVIAG